MFDISFSELLVIGAVALIVIGPARLPGVARTVGHLMGRAQRYVNDVKADIRREVELDELRKLKETMDSAAREVQTSVNEGEAALRAAQTSVQTALQTPLDAPADPVDTVTATEPADALAAASTDTSVPTSADSPARSAPGLAASATGTPT